MNKLEAESKLRRGLIEEVQKNSLGHFPIKGSLKNMDEWERGAQLAYRWRPGENIIESYAKFIADLLKLTDSFADEREDTDFVVSMLDTVSEIMLTADKQAQQWFREKYLDIIERECLKQGFYYCTNYDKTFKGTVYVVSVAFGLLYDDGWLERRF